MTTETLAQSADQLPARLVPPGRLGRLALFIARRRWPVIGVWIVLTLLGGVAAGQLSSRWYHSLFVPGKPAYEASQRTLKALGFGARAPNVVVFHTSGEATKTGPIERAMQRRRRHARRPHQLMLLHRQPHVRLS
jgi:hypothetical protein